MNNSFNQVVTFTLDKAHFQECFEQSALPVQTKDYRKAAIIGVIGFALMFIEAEHYYIPFFLIALAILEVFHIKYRKTWWVWRQLLSKAALCEVKLIINEKGITTESKYVNAEIPWSDVNVIEETEKGVLIIHQHGRNYLSRSYLTDEMVEFILRQKVTT